MGTQKHKVVDRIARVSGAVSIVVFVLMVVSTMSYMGLVTAGAIPYKQAWFSWWVLGCFWAFVVAIITCVAALLHSNRNYASADVEPHATQPIMPHDSETDSGEMMIMDELNKLQQAVKMMGLDPAKLADFATAEGNLVCKAILLRCVTLNRELLSACGASNIESWEKVFDQLRLPESVSSFAETTTGGG